MVVNAASMVVAVRPSRKVNIQLIGVFEVTMVVDVVVLGMEGWLCKSARAGLLVERWSL